MGTVTTNFADNTYLNSAFCSFKAGFHLCEFGRCIARPVVWACVVCFSNEDSPVTHDRATDFGSWIEFNFFATSTSRTNQIALILSRFHSRPHFPVTFGAILPNPNPKPLFVASLFPSR